MLSLTKTTLICCADLDQEGWNKTPGSRWREGEEAEDGVLGNGYVSRTHHLRQHVSGTDWRERHRSEETSLWHLWGRWVLICLKSVTFQWKNCYLAVHLPCQVNGMNSVLSLVSDSTWVQVVLIYTRKYCICRFYCWAVWKILEQNAPCTCSIFILNATFAVITIAIWLRYDYDVLRAPASIRRDSTWAKNEYVSFSS